jgi:hypothetical protein
MNRRVWILLATILLTVFIVYLFPAIPQSEAYHNFADTRAFLGIPNFLNVASNALFLVVGLPGMWFTLRASAEPNTFVDSRERWPYFVFFVGVTLTAFGSAWYHLRPNDHTLVWDRIPMAIAFMSLVAALVAERIDVAAGVRLLLPLVAVALGFYAIAKFFEVADRIVFAAPRVVSGHTIKHVFAALSAYWILRMLRLRTPISQN